MNKTGKLSSLHLKPGCYRYVAKTLSARGIYECQQSVGSTETGYICTETKHTFSTCQDDVTVLFHLKLSAAFDTVDHNLLIVANANPNLGLSSAKLHQVVCVCY